MSVASPGSVAWLALVARLNAAGVTGLAATAWANVLDTTTTANMDPLDIANLVAKAPRPNLPSRTYRLGVVGPPTFVANQGDKAEDQFGGEWSYVGSSWITPDALPVSNVSLLLPCLGAPAAGLGNDGDYAFDANTGNVWGPRASGAWPAAAKRGTTPAGISSSLIPARWYPASAGTGTALQLTISSAIALPFGVTDPHTFTAIGCNITIAGTGGTLRYAVYADNGSGYPGALVQDFGTVAATGTGATSITANCALSPGLYWLVIVGQGGSVQPTVTTWNPVFAVALLGSSGPGVGAGNSGYGGATIAAAAPATFPVGAGLLGANAVPYVQMKA